MPHRSSAAQPWRMQGSRYRLEATQCSQCNNIDFPQRKICSKCGGTTLGIKQLEGKGIVVSFTVIHTAPEGFEGNTPYAIGLIRLLEGPVITSQIVGEIKNIEIGKDVSAVFRKIYEDGESGLIHYGFKFELLE